jgi:tRNA threonylcarbamoyladenosine biosynthesis protein TsaE
MIADSRNEARAAALARRDGLDTTPGGRERVMEWTTATEDETRAVGRGLGARLAPDGVLLLSGELGSGKTVLAQGVAAGLGIDPAEVQSPTYTLVREHAGPGGRLIHVDLYRLATADEVLDAGLEEVLAGPGVKVVEWAERLPFRVPGALHLTLTRRDGGGGREIRRIGEG